MPTINTDQEYPDVTLTITNARGEVAQVDGIPTWASSDETVIAVIPRADGMGAKVSTVAPGVARVSVQADADLGEGVLAITGVTNEDITVILGPSGAASVMTLNLGEPAAKSAA